MMIDSHPHPQLLTELTRLMILGKNQRAAYHGKRWLSVSQVRKFFVAK